MSGRLAALVHGLLTPPPVRVQSAPQVYKCLAFFRACRNSTLGRAVNLHATRGRKGGVSDKYAKERDAAALDEPFGHQLSANPLMLHRNVRAATCSPH